MTYHSRRQGYGRGMYAQGAMQGYGRDWQDRDWPGREDDERRSRGMRGEWPDYSTAGRGFWEDDDLWSRMGPHDEWDYRDEGLGRRVALGAKSTFRGVKGYKRSDERIREDVCDRINHMSRLDGVDAGNVEVTVREGEVTLTGTLDDRRYKHMMENIADRVDGVRDVHNEIRIPSALDRDAVDTSESTGNRSSYGRSERVGNDRHTPGGTPRHA